MDGKSVECTGLSLPDKNNYVTLINAELEDNKEKSWESCYNVIEKKIKEKEQDKDLSSIKKILQEKGYVNVRDTQYAIGTII